MKKKALVLAVAAILAGCNDNSSDPNTPVVAEKNLVIGLGLQVNFDTCNSRVLLEQRVDRAYSVGSQLEDVLYVFTGKGNPTSIKSCDVNNTGRTEAKAMKEILMAKYKVAEENILLEEQSISTNENASYLYEILKEKKQKNELIVKDMYLVTSAYHNHRANYKEGSDISSVNSFNQVFGEGTFDKSSNVFSSSELAKEEKWSQDGELVAPYKNADNTARVFGDLNGNKRSDLVTVDYATGETSVYFSSTQNSLKNTNTPYNFPATGNVALADVNGNGNNDLVGTSKDGLYIAKGNGDGTFADAQLVSNEFTSEDNLHFFDITGNKQAELIHFAKTGTFSASLKDAELQASAEISSDFGSQSYTDNKTIGHLFGDASSDYPRFVADVTGNGVGDIVAFGHENIYVAVNKGDGTYQDRAIWLTNDTEGNTANFVKGREFADLNRENQWNTAWTSARHPRGVADINGNGRADIWAIGEHGVYVAWAADIDRNGEADHFENLNSVWVYETKVRYNQDKETAFQQFTPHRGWTSTAQYPRTFTDLNGNGRADLIGFGDDAVYVSTSENP